MSNNKNVTKFHVLLWKIIVTSAKDSSALWIIDKIIVSLMGTLGPYSYVSICMHSWSYYSLCQCLLEELGIYGIQNSSVHQLIQILYHNSISFTRFFFYHEVIIPVCSYYNSQFFFLFLRQCAFPPSPNLFFISCNSLWVKTTSGVIMDVSGHGGCIQLKLDTDNNTTAKRSSE